MYTLIETDTRRETERHAYRHRETRKKETERYAAAHVKTDRCLADKLETDHNMVAQRLLSETVNSESIFINKVSKRLTITSPGGLIDRPIVTEETGTEQESAFVSKYTTSSAEQNMFLKSIHRYVDL